MHELKNVVRGVANSVAPHLRALGGMETQPVASFRLKRVPLPLFVPFCPMLSRVPTWRRNRKRLLSRLEPVSTHERKGFSSASFPFRGVARSHARAERKKKSVLSHLVSFATNGELELGFRGKLIIGTRRGGIWEGLIIGCIFLVNR